MELRRFVPLAPAPGAVLAYVIYALDGTREAGGYPVHQWAVIGVIAGWCLMVAGLTLLAPSLVTAWMALAAAMSFIAGPLGSSGKGETALFALGFVLAAALILIATATYVVRHNAARRRIAWAAALTALGAGSAFSDNSAAQMWAVLALSPAAVGLGALWLRLDRPPAADLSSVGVTATFGRRFLAGSVGWVTFTVALGVLSTGGGLLAALAYPVCVIFIQVVPTARWGRTLGQVSTGLRVIRVDTGEPPGWVRSLVRFTVFQAVPLLGVIYLVAWATHPRAGFGRGLPDRLAWDRASGTAVVRVPRPAPRHNGGS